MRTFSLYRFGGSCPITLPGDNIVDAVEGNFPLIAREARVGNVAGYQLHRVRLEYRPEIIGGKGGVEVRIEATGLDLAHKPASPEIQTSRAWINARPEDLPNPVELELK